MFIVFTISALGCGFAVVATRVPRFKVPAPVIDVGRHFGTGVILATAFAHMLVHSIHHLMSPENPGFLPSYSPFAAIIAAVAALAMHVLETLFASQAGGDHNKEGCHGHMLILKRRKLITYILELGILSHSIFVGITLGLAKSGNFVKLLIAICFHQFFEGVGLGARIADIQFKDLFMPFLMVFSYSITTSLGIGLGIAIHSSYDPHSPSASITEGCLDAISAGILIYTGIVELLGREFSRTSGFSEKSHPIKMLYLTSVYLGAVAMIVIGKVI
ncbi:hypothetical protein DSO57_1036186 [Entomophthora muscae]|uniref:Uncharacterized protein n=1 Tax=Entomophthora muscae TaxID=34485 RepID=A0ACC2TYD3_9FUNG|nr:hypothetical protein DSO57_1036186 [Entomophthora muscae]